MADAAGDDLIYNQVAVIIRFVVTVGIFFIVGSANRQRACGGTPHGIVFTVLIVAAEIIVV